MSVWLSYDNFPPAILGALISYWLVFKNIDYFEAVGRKVLSNFPQVGK
jgi:hypothetical protein